MAGAHKLWLLLAVLIAALNLRLGIAAPGPVIETIRDDTGMSSALAGVLITIPFACMSAFAFAGPPMIRRGSPYGVILLALLSIGSGTLLRAVAPTPVLMILATVPIGMGIALAGVALPVVVREQFASRSGAVTAGYVSSFSIGVVVIAVAIGPLADAVGGWREAFAISALPALIAAVVWVGATRGLGRPGARPRPAAGGAAPAAGGGEPAAGTVLTVPGRRRPDRVELLAAASFGLQSMTYAGLVGWVAALYVDAGWSEGTASLATALLGLFVIPGSLFFASISQGRDRRPWLAATVAVMAVGLIGIGLAPEAAPLLWLAAFGGGGGSALALQLALPIDLRASPDGVARLTGWMLGLGYVLSAIAPTVVGALRDATGGFTVPITGLGVVSLLGIVVALMLPPPLSARERELPAAAPPAP
jgi:MFS transporter, CP family, cyanate transporter